jgi:type I restriction enzyme M protein
MSGTTGEAQEELFAIDTSDSTDDSTVAEGYVLDFITGQKQLKGTPKEQVRQRIARALFHEYGISVEDMEPDFPVRINGRRKRLDIAIFHHGKEHDPEHLSRVVVCRPEPKVGKAAVRMRDYNQAEKDLDELKTIMQDVDACHYGLWTNGLEFFYLEKKVTRFQIGFEPIGDWPLAEESVGTRDVVSHAKTRRANPDMLRIAFRRCHNFIHGNEGMPKDAAFWQFLYLIFCKMHDERAPRQARRFWAGPKEQFDPTGR